MSIMLLVALSILILLILILTLLFGQNPLLARTPLPRLHRALVGGARGLAHGTAAAAGRLCGRRASAALDAAADLCCERSNPVVQALFLALLCACYAAFVAFVFPMLPQPGVPAWHKCAGRGREACALRLGAAGMLPLPLFYGAAAAAVSAS